MPDAPEQQQPNQEDRIFATIGYLSILCFLPLAFKPKSPFCQFHGHQGLIMAAVGFFVLLLFAAIPLIGFFVVLGFLALDLYAMYQAYSGKEWKIPVIGDLTTMVRSGFKNLQAPAQPPAEKTSQEPPQAPEQPQPTSQPTEPPASPPKTPPTQ